MYGLIDDLQILFGEKEHPNERFKKFQIVGSDYIDNPCSRIRIRMIGIVKFVDFRGIYIINLWSIEKRGSLQPAFFPWDELYFPNKEIADYKLSILDEQERKPHFKKLISYLKKENSKKSMGDNVKEFMEKFKYSEYSFPHGLKRFKGNTYERYK